MGTYMVTHSLLSSWMYSMKENPFADAETTRNPWDEFLSTLRREPSIPNEAMQRGIDFEDLVTNILDGTAQPLAKYYHAADEIADIVRGGILQYVAKKWIKIGEDTILLYGRIDALKAGTIYDIKFSSGYETGKYFDSTQHPMYFAIVPEATDFTYLVSNGSVVWPETYRREETKDIVDTIKQFYMWLDAQGLTEEYREHWTAL